MTTAPACLMEVRALLRDYLHIPPLALGVVGDTSHAEGGDSYHLGADQIRARNGRDRYSVDESARDRNGLTNDATALDIGEFSVRVDGKAHNLQTFCVWLIAQCRAGTADTRDIREVIYSPDGNVVKRWDRLGRRTSGDGSHKTHTHISWFRDAIKAGRDQTPVFRRYLTEIGLLAGEDDDMTPDQAQQLKDATYVLGGKSWPNPAGDGKVDMRTWGAWMTGAVKALATAVGSVDEATKAQLQQDLLGLQAEIDAVPTRTVEALGLVESPEQIAAILGPVLGDKAAVVGQILARG